MPAVRLIDSITVVALEDGEGPFFDSRDVAFADATEDHWREADRRDPASVRNGGWWLHFRCYALRLPTGRVILVDTGIGSALAPSRTWAPVPGLLPQELAAAGIAVSDVDTVVLTHMHTDHIGWSVADDGRPYFPNARYLLQRAEMEAIDARAPGLAEFLLRPLREAGQLAPVDSAERLAPAVEIVATPGHTPGHQSVLLDTGRERLLVTGDLFVHAVQLVDPTLGYAHEEDPDMARESRVRLLRELADRGGAVLATPHLGDPFVDLTAPGRVRPTGPAPRPRMTD